MWCPWTSCGNTAQMPLCQLPACSPGKLTSISLRFELKANIMPVCVQKLEAAGLHLLSLDQLRQQGAAAPVLPAEVQRADLASICFSGGATREPTVGSAPRVQATARSRCS